jgi:hypothetical protein
METKINNLKLILMKFIKKNCTTKNILSEKMKIISNLEIDIETNKKIITDIEKKNNENILMNLNFDLFDENTKLELNELLELKSFGILSDEEYNEKYTFIVSKFQNNNLEIQESLAKLKELLEYGILSEDEFKIKELEILENKSKSVKSIKKNLYLKCPKKKIMDDQIKKFNLSDFDSLFFFEGGRLNGFDWGVIKFDY